MSQYLIFLALIPLSCFELVITIQIHLQKNDLRYLYRTGCRSCKLCTAQIYLCADNWEISRINWTSNSPYTWMVRVCLYDRHWTAGARDCGYRFTAYYDKRVQWPAVCNYLRPDGIFWRLKTAKQNLFSKYLPENHILRIRNQFFAPYPGEKPSWSFLEIGYLDIDNASPQEILPKAVTSINRNELIFQSIEIISETNFALCRIFSSFATGYLY